jgi:single-strand DNA-binding protein
MSINKVFISGNLTRDCELRQTQGGTAILTFGVAVNDRAKNPQTGEWEDRPNFVDCAMFGKRAEAVERFLSKGQKVAIEGKLRYSSWEKDGQKRSKLSVIVDELEFMSRREGGQGNGSAQTANYSSGGGNAPNSAPQEPQGDYFDESIPF